jgi:type IV pilus assembly protein PilA
MHRKIIDTLRQQGFSFVELIIVIVIIGILAVLALSSYGAYEARVRDTRRETSINALDTQLEACYNSACNGSYPSLTQLQDDSSNGWIAKNFKNFNKSVLYDSKGKKIQSQAPSDAAEYQYEPFKADGSLCGTGEICTSFTLKAWQEENSADLYVMNSLNK